MKLPQNINEICRKISMYMFVKKIRNTPTIISRDCCGGIIYHDCQKQFMSPTINLFMSNDDFLLFCEHLRGCLATI